MSLALALPKLVQDLENIQLQLSTATDPAAARTQCAQLQAQAIYEFVVQGLVITAGTPTSHTGTIQ